MEDQNIKKRIRRLVYDKYIEETDYPILQIDKVKPIVMNLGPILDSFDCIPSINITEQCLKFMKIIDKPIINNYETQ